MTRERTTSTRNPRETATEPGKGVAGLAIAWKVAAFLPLVLTGAVLAGRIDLGDDPATTSSPSANQVVIDSRTPNLEELDHKNRKSDRKRDRDKKTDGPSPTDAPTSEATSAPPTLSPSKTPTADPTRPDPTKSPTKSPTKTPTPSETPTPGEAEDMCREAGVNPLDLPAMADCIAKILGGG
jgi:hypothetical protein